MESSQSGLLASSSFEIGPPTTFSVPIRRSQRLELRFSKSVTRIRVVARGTTLYEGVPIPAISVAEFDGDDVSIEFNWSGKSARVGVSHECP